jgi:hypothetical protein
MPSSPKYQRNYKQEYATAKARGENEGNALRHKARAQLENAGRVHTGDGKDVDHVRPISKGGGNAGNLRVRSASNNRSFSRKPDGSVR